MKFLKFILERNKILNCIFIGAIIISTSYKLTMNYEQWFKVADRIYNFFSQISLAIISSYIFFIIQSEYSSFKKMKESNEILKPKLKYLIE